MKILGHRVSKKLFMALCSAVLIVLNEGLGMSIPTETVLSFMGVVATYIFGQALIDKELAKK